MADIKSNLPVTDSADGLDGSAAPSNSTQIGGKDSSGNLQSLLTLATGELFTRDVINTSSQFRAQSVTTTAAEALGGATILLNRKVLIITPTNGTIYWGTANTVTTTTGSPIFANQTLTLAFTDNLHVFLIAAATVDSRILEGS